MKKIISLTFLFYSFLVETPLFAQLDPSLMAKLSQLSPQQRQQLMNQKSIGGTQFGGPVPTSDLNTRNLEVETPDEDSFESRSNYLKDLAEMEAMVLKDVENLEKEIEQTRQEVEPSFLSSYDRVTTIVSRPPYMAPISDQKCSGCHLRVSNDVVSSALVEKKITQCDQCGRIVYIER